ncbi:hypothetical protein HNY73_022378 [Argiope bruennichi]|uniref:Uncharacterized protein n=1 Tax=Argiope bruennichi TaxID=94029 RepID=A0A8T0E208_ARGBR|nr:hypothetical protein HNY73_022378 [Argiope bruennichi]
MKRVVLRRSAAQGPLPQPRLPISSMGQWAAPLSTESNLPVSPLWRPRPRRPSGPFRSRLTLRFPPAPLPPDPALDIHPASHPSYSATAPPSVSHGPGRPSAYEPGMAPSPSATRCRPARGSPPLRRRRPPAVLRSECVV